MYDHLLSRVCCLFLIMLLTTSTGIGQSTSEHNSCVCLPVDDNTVVQFFYLPANDHLHPALIFRVAQIHSPSLNTAPITNHGGRTPYISLVEMRDLVRRLSDAGLTWHKSREVQAPGIPKFRQTTGQLEIKVFSPKGTALSVSDPKRICKILPSLDSALKQPRALWEFQLFRLEYHCEVPGFNRNAYPEHDYGNR